MDAEMVGSAMWYGPVGPRYRDISTTLPLATELEGGGSSFQACLLRVFENLSSCKPWSRCLSGLTSFTEVQAQGSYPEPA